MPTLKSPTSKYRYLATVLTRVVFFVQVSTDIATILSVFHVAVSNGK